MNQEKEVFTKEDIDKIEEFINLIDPENKIFDKTRKEIEELEEN